jgi:hypothetical protein
VYFATVFKTVKLFAWGLDLGDPHVILVLYCKFIRPFICTISIELVHGFGLFNDVASSSKYIVE